MWLGLVFPGTHFGEQSIYLHHVPSCLSDSDPELHVYHMGILGQVFETFRTSKGFKGLAALE